LCSVLHAGSLLGILPKIVLPVNACHPIFVFQEK
jgi:hypothetical protein